MNTGDLDRWMGNYINYASIGKSMYFRLLAGLGETPVLQAHSNHARL